MTASSLSAMSDTSATLPSAPLARSWIPLNADFLRYSTQPRLLYATQASAIVSGSSSQTIACGLLPATYSFPPTAASASGFQLVAASVEIARRAYRKFQKGWIYPSYDISQQRYVEVLGNQWKEELELRYMSWKGLAGIVKESKLKYQFPLQPSKAVFSKTYMNSCTTVYNYS